MKKYVLNLSLLVVAMALPLSVTQANVNLISDQANYNVAAGNTFNVTLSLQITSTEQVTGVDYYLNNTASVGFTITAANRTTSYWGSANTYFTDAQVASGLDTQSPAGADNALNPRNDYDLGESSNAITATSANSPAN